MANPSQCRNVVHCARQSLENGYVESFNGKLRDELLNEELFLSMAEARWVTDGWRLDYNHRRPHSALDYQTSAACAARCSSFVQPTASFQKNHGPMNPDSLAQGGTKSGGRTTPSLVSRETGGDDAILGNVTRIVAAYPSSERNRASPSDE